MRDYVQQVFEASLYGMHICMLWLDAYLWIAFNNGLPYFVGVISGVGGMRIQVIVSQHEQTSFWNWGGELYQIMVTMMD